MGAGWIMGQDYHAGEGRKLPEPILHSANGYHAKTQMRPLSELSCYPLEAQHSTIGFEVSYLGLAAVVGRFTTYEGGMIFNGKKLVYLNGNIRSSSIDTSNGIRNENLKGNDFFNTLKFPNITFQSTEVTHDEDGKLHIRGNLTILGRTNEVALLGDFGGFVTMTDQKTRKCGVSLEGSIDRRDFGLNYHAEPVGGREIIGNLVKIRLQLTGSRVGGIEERDPE